MERDPSRPIPKRKPFRRPTTNQQPPQTIDDFLLAGRTQPQQQPHDPLHATNQQQHAAATAVEGYIPSRNTTTSTTQQPQGSAAVAAVSFSNDSASADTTAASTKTHHGAKKGGDNPKDDDQTPLYIHSLAELMEAAGETLPPPSSSTAPIAPGDILEADLEFSVMTQQDYDKDVTTFKQQQEEERQQQLQVVMGKPNLFPDESSSSGDDDDDGNEDMREEEDDDDIMEIYMANEDEVDEGEDQIHYDEEDENRPEPEAKPFRLLWQALTDWMTPQTVSWIKSLRLTDSAESNSSSNNHVMDNEWAPMVDRSDIGSSRYAGVMAMLKLYLTGCMKELHYPSEDRRRAEKRLTDLLRTFDYSRENPKLHVSHWKAMTCILLDMVMANDPSARELPSPVAALNMSLEEYQYLSQKTIQTYA